MCVCVCVCVCVKQYKLVPSTAYFSRKKTGDIGEFNIYSLAPKPNWNRNVNLTPTLQFYWVRSIASSVCYFKPIKPNTLPKPTHIQHKILKTCLKNPKWANVWGSEGQVMSSVGTKKGRKKRLTGPWTQVLLDKKYKRPDGVEGLSSKAKISLGCGAVERLTKNQLSRRSVEVLLWSRTQPEHNPR